MPMFNIIILLALIAAPIMWASKAKGYGMFSALLNLFCAIVAGGIAFALWEPLVYSFVLTNAKNESIVRNIGWTVCLLGPYVVVYFVLRLIVDTLIKANLKFSDAANFIGGFVFGLGAGIISTGITAIAFSNLRLPAEILGYEALSDEDAGNLVYRNKLWVPVDVLTAKFYETLSLGGFGSQNALALHMPDVHIQAALNRAVAHSEDDRRIGYTHIASDAVKIAGRYAVTASIDALRTDTLSVSSPQQILDIRGEPITGESTLHGFVIEFQPGAREGSGQVVVGPGQVRLVARNADNTDAKVFNAIAIIAESDTKGVLSRYPVNSRNLYIGSVGSAQSSSFAFEYIVPNQWTPTELIIRGTRFPLQGDLAQPKLAFDTVAARDRAVVNRNLFEELGIKIGGTALANVDASNATMIPLGNQNMPTGLSFTPQLPYNFNIPITDARSKFLLDADNKMINGEGDFTNELLLNRETARSLRVNSFATPGDVRVVQVSIARTSQLSEFGNAINKLASKEDTPYLIAEDGRAFACVGFLYTDGTSTTIRFKPDALIHSYMRDVPQLSVSQRDESLVLFFLVNSDSRLTGLTIGTTQAAIFPRPVRQQ